MGINQDMSRTLGRTQTSAGSRIAALYRNGHRISIDSSPNHATITITRKGGRVHHITVTPEDLPSNVTYGNAYRAHPQSVLIANAMHAIADWSATIEEEACHGCGGEEPQAIYNNISDSYDWYCPTCIYGEAA
jgi:hypothetical protein